MGRDRAVARTAASSKRSVGLLPSSSWIAVVENVQKHEVLPTIVDRGIQMIAGFAHSGSAT